MQNIKVKQGQTFFDAVIESTGSITNAFEMALVNHLSITDVVFNQIDLVVSGSENKAITKLFIDNKPASLKFEITNEIEIDYLFPQTLPYI